MVSSSCRPRNVLFLMLYNPSSVWWFFVVSLSPLPPKKWLLGQAAHFFFSLVHQVLWFCGVDCVAEYMQLPEEVYISKKLGIFLSWAWKTEKMVQGGPSRWIAPSGILKFEKVITSCLSCRVAPGSYQELKHHSGSWLRTVVVFGRWSISISNYLDSHQQFPLNQKQKKMWVRMLIILGHWRQKAIWLLVATD